MDPDPVSNWTKLESVIVALQRSMLNANDLMAGDKAEFQFVVSGFNITFPAEIRTEGEEKTLVRFPFKEGDKFIPERESSLSRLSISLRPIPELTD